MNSNLEGGRYDVRPFCCVLCYNNLAMTEELYEKICAGEEVRANLIALKRALCDAETCAAFRESRGGDYDGLMKCLADPDPKARKNAADLLGLLRVQEAVDVLMDAYEAEETRYVRADYVRALSALDCGSCLDSLRERLTELEAYDAPADERKHVQEEVTALRELLLAKEGITKHRFIGQNRENSVILTTLPAFAELLARDLPFHLQRLENGVAGTVSDMDVVLACRYWQEMLLVLDRNLLQILRENHRGEAPFYFRVGVTGPLDRAARSALAKRAAAALEEKFPRMLINSPSHYEIEIRLAADAAGRVTSYLKLFTIPDDRFRYRRYHVAAGMKPVMAAGLIGLMKPYLKEHAQVLDPFCGVGTLLIERRYAGAVRSAYGIDTFGEAIDKARRNAQIAGMPIHYIHRDFFDFTHEYLFDEIITDLPTEIGDRAETDAFYAGFLAKSAGLLSPRGRIFCYTGETGLFKKHLRLCGRYRVLAEFPILERGGTALFVLERRN